MMSDERKDLVWEEVETEHVLQDEWIDFRRSTYRFPDGAVVGPFYSISRRDFAVIVARDEEGRYICVRQYRHGINKVTTEFPAGGLERADGKDYGPREEAEDALEGAKRELLEETGYVSDHWKHLITVPSYATIADNYAFVYVAENCRKVTGQSLDETEFLNVVLLPPAELEERVRDGRFEQAIHIMAWALSR